MNSDLISIIIPLYNKEKSICKTIESVILQTIDYWELIIVDDGSIDESSTQIQKYLKNHRIRYYKKANGGVSSARNYGLHMSKGNWIIFLDADDTFLPSALETLIKIAHKYHCPINTGNFYWVDDNLKKKFYKKRGSGIISNNFRSSFFRQFGARAGVQLFARETLQDHIFDEKLSRYEDAKTEFNVFRKYKVAYTYQPVLKYNLEYSTLSRNFNYAKDFISELSFENKGFWEIMLLFELLIQGISIYKEQNIKEKYRDVLWLMPIYYILDIARRIYWKIIC